MMTAAKMRSALGMSAPSSAVRPRGATPAVENSAPPPSSNPSKIRSALGIGVAFRGPTAPAAAAPRRATPPPAAASSAASASAAAAESAASASASAAASVDAILTAAASSGSEGLVRQVLAELERERNRRIDLEAGLLRRAFRPPDRHPAATAEAEGRRRGGEAELRMEVASLRAERDGLAQVVEAVTGTSDAVKVASDPMRAGETLSADVVRLLEYAPWDERAGGHISAVEEIYEWETYDDRTGEWSGRMEDFPDDFRSARGGGSRAKKAAGGTVLGMGMGAGGWGVGGGSGSGSGSGSGGGGGNGGNGGARRPGDRVITDGSCSRLLDLTDGYPLPSRGTWEWVSGWRAVHRGDGDVWSYASRPELLAPSRRGGGSLTTEGPGGDDDDDGGEQRFRRRRWTRRRVLVGYPSVRDMTRHFLRLNAERARADVDAEDLYGQVLRLKMDVAERDDELGRMRREREERIEAERRIDQMAEKMRLLQRAQAKVAPPGGRERERERERDTNDAAAGGGGGDGDNPAALGGLGDLLRNGSGIKTADTFTEPASSEEGSDSSSLASLDRRGEGEGEGRPLSSSSSSSSKWKKVGGGKSLMAAILGGGATIGAATAAAGSDERRGRNRIVLHEEEEEQPQARPQTQGRAEAGIASKLGFLGKIPTVPFDVPTVRF